MFPHLLLLLLSHFSCVQLWTLQLCPTHNTPVVSDSMGSSMCDPIDGSPLGSPIPGSLQARTLEWVAISFSSAWKLKVKVKSLSPVWFLATPWTAAYQAPVSMGFSRQEYWSGMPLPSLVSPSICHEVMGQNAIILVFCMLNFKPLYQATFSLSSFTFIKRLFSSSLSAIKLVSSAYLRLLTFFTAILIPACASSSPVFLLMYSAYKLNKQDGNIQPWHSPFPIWTQSVVPCSVLTVASWPAYRFLRRQVRWSGIPIYLKIFHTHKKKNFAQFVVIHRVKDFHAVNKSEVDVFLKLSCFFYDPMDVGNLISGSSAFSKFIRTLGSSQFTY